MARRPITLEIYTALIAAYRDAPGNHQSAGRHAGVFWRTAKRGWEEGWPADPWAAKPIREVIAEEQALARQRLSEMDKAKEEALKRGIEEASRRAAELAVQPQAERDKVRQDAIEAREQEGLAVRLARSQAISLLQTMGDLVPAIKSLVQQTVIAVSQGAGGEMTVGGLVRMLREFTAAAKAVNEATEMALKMERLVLGEPTEVLGLMAVDMGTEEAIHEILATQEALVRIQSTGGRVLPMTSSNGHAHGLGQVIDADATTTTLDTVSSDAMEESAQPEDPLEVSDQDPFADEQPVDEDFG